MTTEERYQHPEYLVETAWLEDHLADPELRIFDCTVIAKLNAEAGGKVPFLFESGRAQFDKGHIPGAGFLDLLGDLSDRSSALPFVLPSARQFGATMAKAGIGDGARVVLYGTAEPIWAARIWWILRTFGFDNVAILNGGWTKWNAEGRPVSDLPHVYEPARFSPRERPESLVGKAAVLAAIDDAAVLTINALPAPIFAGTGGPVFGRRGRIPGSVNVPFGSLHDPESGAYLAAGPLRDRFEAVGAHKAERIIAYCGSGIAASNDAFALALLGYDNVALYDASLAEWGHDESLPMETD